MGNHPAMTPLKYLTLPTLFAFTASAHAGITIAQKEDNDFASTIGGFRLTLNDPGASVEFTAPDAAPLPPRVMLTGVTLTARKAKARDDVDSAEALRLKIYEDASRTKLVAESKNAHNWSPGYTALQPGTEATYTFAGAPLLTDKPYYFVFETESGPAKPVGKAGLQLNKEAPTTTWKVLNPTQGVVLGKCSPKILLAAQGLPTPAAPKPAAKQEPKPPRAQEPAPVAAKPATPPGYRVMLGEFREYKWKDIKPDLLALPGVTGVRGKVTGEILLSVSPGKTLSRETLERVAKARAMTVTEFTPLDKEP